MHATAVAAAKASSRRISFRRTWMTPGLSSGQLLDAGITRRQSQSRKNLKKAQRPFDAYFRCEFRCTLHSSPAVGRRGILSARDAARLMTDPDATWGAPWAVAARGVRTRGKRQDALERPEEAFGEDELDRVIAALVELRFQWDREDGVVATSQVPESLYSATEHCAPYARRVAGGGAAASSTRRGGGWDSGAAGSDGRDGGGDDDGESLLIDGTRVYIGKSRKKRAGHPKSEFRRPRWGFTGVDTVPSVVTDVVQGPLLTSSNEFTASLRWAADNRDSASVVEVMRLRRSIPGAVVVGLPPRSAFLLLKAAATAEVTDPATDVGLLTAVSEHYGSLEMTECLELLRCVRRLAYARGLSGVTVDLMRAASLLSTSSSEQPCYYANAALTQNLMSSYVSDSAPSLVSRVWARLPEHSRRLLSHEYYLDWIDLLSLTLEVSGPGRLPSGLPNSASRAPYASKFLFFQYTLGIDDGVMTSFVEHMTSPASAAAAGGAGAGGGDGAVGYVDAEAESRVRPCTMWVCAALLTRIVAECLGDVLDHVSRSLHEHAQLAAEGEAAVADTVDLDGYLDRLSLPRPHVAGVQPLQSRLRPKKVRVRLLPYAAFPTVLRCFPTPAHRETQRAMAMERGRRHGHRQRGGSAPASRQLQPQSPPKLESPFAAVLRGSDLAAMHVDRATAALEWATMVLRHCLRLVADLPPLPPAPQVVPLATATAEGQQLRRPLENASAMALRELLCDHYTRSKVELLLDSLFTFISWDEAEGTIKPLLECPGLQDEPQQQQSLAGGGGEGVEGASAALSETEALSWAMVDDDIATAEPSGGRGEAHAGEEGSGSGGDLSEAEQHMRAVMTRLQARVSDFQVAVADLLDAQDRFFPPSPTTTDESTL